MTAIVKLGFFTESEVVQKVVISLPAIPTPFVLTLQLLNNMHHELFPSSYLVPSGIPSSLLALRVCYDSCVIACRCTSIARSGRGIRLWPGFLGTHTVPISCLMSSEQFRPGGWIHCILRSETKHPRFSSCRRSTHSSSCLRYS